VSLFVVTTASVHRCLQVATISTTKTLQISYDVSWLAGRCVQGSVTISGVAALVNYMSRFGGIACPTVITISSSSSSPHHLFSSQLYPHHLHQLQQLGPTIQPQKTLIDAHQRIVARNSTNFGSELSSVCLQISIDNC